MYLRLVQVNLPADSVVLAYDLVYSGESSAGPVAHVTMAQDLDGSAVLAVLSVSGQLSFFAVNAATGTVTRKSNVTEGVEAAVSVELAAEHLTGALPLDD